MRADAKLRRSSKLQAPRTGEKVFIEPARRRQSRVRVEAFGLLGIERVVFRDCRQQQNAEVVSRVAGVLNETQRRTSSVPSHAAGGLQFIVFPPYRLVDSATQLQSPVTCMPIL
jgi:hypothetical protein